MYDEIKDTSKKCWMWAFLDLQIVHGLVLSYYFGKTDGKLWFCIDLQKLNARTITDPYSLPRNDKTLDCLNGAEWFSSLD